MFSIKNNKSAIIWLGSAHLVSDFYTGFLNPLMPFLAAKLGFSMAIATVIIAITQICSNMLQPVFGFFADNFYKRFFIFWGVVLVSTFVPLAVLAPNAILLTLSMILGCLGSSFFHPQAMGFINIFSQENHSNNMGIFVSLGSLGFALGPLFASFITQIIGLESIKYTSLLGITLACLMFIFVPKLSLSQSYSKKLSFFKTFNLIVKNSQIKLLILISMMKSIVTNSSCILLPFLWKTLGHGAFYIGVSLFLFVFAGSIGSYFSPRLEEKFGSKTIIYFSMWATFPMMFIFSILYESFPFLSMLLFALMGFTTMLAQPVTLVKAQKALPEFKSIVSGLINGFCWGVVALLLSGLGAIAEKFGIINVLLVLTILPLFFSYYVRFLKED